MEERIKLFQYLVNTKEVEHFLDKWKDSNSKFLYHWFTIDASCIQYFSYLLQDLIRYKYKTAERYIKNFAFRLIKTQNEKIRTGTHFRSNQIITRLRIKNIPKIHVSMGNEGLNYYGNCLYFEGSIVNIIGERALIIRYAFLCQNKECSTCFYEKYPANRVCPECGELAEEYKCGNIIINEFGFELSQNSLNWGKCTLWVKGPCDFLQKIIIGQKISGIGLIKFSNKKQFHINVINIQKLYRSVHSFRFIDPILIPFSIMKICYLISLLLYNGDMVVQCISESNQQRFIVELFSVLFWSKIIYPSFGIDDIIQIICNTTCPLVIIPFISGALFSFYEKIVCSLNRIRIGKHGNLPVVVIISIKDDKKANILSIADFIIKINDPIDHDYLSNIRHINYTFLQKKQKESILCTDAQEMILQYIMKSNCEMSIDQPFSLIATCSQLISISQGKSQIDDDDAAISIMFFEERIHNSINNRAMLVDIYKKGLFWLKIENDAIVPDNSIIQIIKNIIKEYLCSP